MSDSQRDVFAAPVHLKNDACSYFCARIHVPREHPNVSSDHAMPCHACRGQTYFTHQENRFQEDGEFNLIRYTWLKTRRLDVSFTMLSQVVPSRTPQLKRERAIFFGNCGAQVQSASLCCCLSDDADEGPDFDQPIVSDAWIGYDRLGCNWFAL